MISMGAKDVVMCDRKGIIYKGRTEGMNASKEEIAEFTNKLGRKGTLAEALVGADLFVGVSSPGAVTEEMVKSMNKGAIVLPMANPTPEIMPDLALKAGAAVVGTGRSDFPNQINNVLAFPGIFRGALDCRASDINEEMKIAAAKAIAAIAQQPASKEIEAQYGRTFTFGKEYILPKPGDKRLLTQVSSAVARAAMESGVARRGIASFCEYSQTLLKRIESENYFAREYVRHRIGRHGSEREREL
jgi:malate dehydrogenase (oxaloacetate-decarboxylating)